MTIGTDKITGHHEQLTMCKIDEPQDAINHRVSDGDQRISPTERDPGERMLKDGNQTHKELPSLRMVNECGKVIFLWD
jgi:hypothetical protein